MPTRKSTRMQTRKSTRMQTRESKRKLCNSSSMRNTNNTPDLVDRISELPDSILGLILSFLPTKNAIATSILSKRWKFVWINVDNLDLCFEDWMDDFSQDIDMDIQDIDMDMRVVQFVNRVLLLHDGGLLNRFRLVWSPSFILSQVQSQEIISWIKTAIKRNVHHLSVSVPRKFGGSELPISLFSYGTSLQSLELNCTICFPTEIVVCLPSLESLKLVSICFQSEESFEKLISGCPVLNYLQVDVDLNKMEAYSIGFREFAYIISSTSLRRLELCVKSSHSHFPAPSLKLEASSLEYIKLAGPIVPVIVQGTLSSLVEVDFRINIYRFSEDTCNSVVESFRTFDRAKTLTLSLDATWAIRNATICLSTKFLRLTKLEARAVSCICSSLQDFIQSSDNLEVLTIVQNPEKLYRYDSNWIAPLEVPGCLSNNLKKVSFKGYASYEGERQMIAYMLKHGRSLEVMQVNCWPRNMRRAYFELQKDINSFPRKSPAISFHIPI